MLKKLLIKWLVSLLDEGLPKRELRGETFVLMMSKAYQNPAIQNYLDEREEFLKANGIDLIIQDKLEGAKGLAGQVIEIRLLRNKMRACYTQNVKGQKEKKTKFLKTRKRQHSQ